MKHLSNFSKFIIEQDLGFGAPPAPAKKTQEFSFVFIEPDEYSKVYKKKYPDGTSSANYPTFVATEKELSSWADTNIKASEKEKITEAEVSVKKNNFLEILKGEKTNASDSDYLFLEKFKNACYAGLSSKKAADTTIFFTKDLEPTTSNISVTFVVLK